MVCLMMARINKNLFDDDDDRLEDDGKFRGSRCFMG